MRKLNKLLPILCFLPFSAFANQDLSVDNAIFAQGVIYKHVDGDTVVVNFSDSDYEKFTQFRNKKTNKNLKNKYNSVRIRVSNIDTPESVNPDSSKNTTRGWEASNFISWIDGEPADVRCFDIGYYGRFICTVAVNGKFDIGYQQILAGYSKYITRWGKNPYLDSEYRQAETGYDRK